MTPQQVEVPHPTIDKMPEDEAFALLDNIRERRLRGALEHARAVALRDKQTQQVLYEAIDKQVRMLEKELVSLDKCIEKVESRANKLRGLRLQYGEYEDDTDQSSSTE